MTRQWKLKMWEDDSFADRGIGPMFVPLAEKSGLKGAKEFDELIEYVNELEEKVNNVLDGWQYGVYRVHTFEDKLEELNRTLQSGGNDG